MTVKLRPGTEPDEFRIEGLARVRIRRENLKLFVVTHFLNYYSLVSFLPKVIFYIS